MHAPVVRLADVSVVYPNGTVALDAVDLTVELGERVALVGPSAAGKSTLLNLMSGRVVSDGAVVSGTVEVLGSDLGGLRGRQRRRHARRIGVVRQDLDLVGPLRVIHNLNAGGEPDGVDRMYTIGKALNFASAFEIDDVIDPADTRATISRAFDLALHAEPRRTKKRPNIDTW